MQSRKKRKKEETNEGKCGKIRKNGMSPYKHELEMALPEEELLYWLPRVPYIICLIIHYRTQIVTIIHENTTIDTF